MFRQIIVALDGSERSKRAAEVGCDLGKHYVGTVTLVHIPHAESAAYIVGAVAGYHAAIEIPTFEEIEEAGQKILNEGIEIAQKLGCTNVKTFMAHGDAATEVITYADQIEADLIVTGRRGLSRFSSLVLGSTTQRITRMAKCACLSVV